MAWRSTTPSVNRWARWGRRSTAAPHDPVRGARALPTSARRAATRRSQDRARQDHRCRKYGGDRGAAFSGWIWRGRLHDGLHLVWRQREAVRCVRQRATVRFNVAPLPGGMTQDLRVLPDGGVLVSSGVGHRAPGFHRRRHPNLRGARRKRPVGGARPGRGWHVLGGQLPHLERLSVQPHQRRVVASFNTGTPAKPSSDQSGAMKPRHVLYCRL